jgi:hypothetical protein
MAGKTELFILHIQKILVLGGMGGMAGKASLFTDDRGMVERDLLTLLFMAIKTECVPPFEDKLWIL